MRPAPQLSNFLRPTARAALTLLVLSAACQNSGLSADDDNPFLDDLSDPGKADTGWVAATNAPEVEVVLESDIRPAGQWQAMMGPTDSTQFALTHLRMKSKVFIESQLVSTENPRKIEWLFDGTWVDATELNYYTVPVDKLTRFRITGVNAVVYKPEDPNALVGKVYEATIPLDPHFVMTRAGDSCADSGGHELYDEDYWYFWVPEKRGCELETTILTATVTAMVSATEPRYPEYDRLLADNQITAILFFGAFGGTSDLTKDKGYKSMISFNRKLDAAGYERTTAPSGLARFTRSANGIQYIVDVSGPADFAGLDDYQHADLFDEGVRTHEVVVYNGHSILGTSDFWRRPDIYPDYYQLFYFNGCLGYEYYASAILEGKGGWDNADVISNIMETPASPQPKVLATFVAALFQGADQGGSMSYQDIIGAMSTRTYNSCYGVSGARTNCFSPNGSLCDEPAPAGGEYTNDTPVEIPDNNPGGATSVIEVTGAFTAGELDVVLDIDHSWTEDLVVTLEHGGRTATLWNRVPDHYDDGVHETFHTAEFAGLDAAGSWTLTITDQSADDTGALVRWSLQFPTE